uniref:RAB1A n=1 Tax=Arundo donax TaxID=35708 RepID=A0A0A9SD27_ARUDO
MTSQHRNHQ